MNKLTLAAVLLTAFVLFGGTETASAQSGSMRWSGSVDDVVQVVIRRRNVSTNTMSGSQTYDARYSFNGRMPRNNVRVWVDKTEGRGRVVIVQQPNRRNRWTTIVQIIDSKGGRDRYRFTLYWD